MPLAISTANSCASALAAATFSDALGRRFAGQFRFGQSRVDQPGTACEQCLQGVQPRRQLTESADDMWFVCGAVHAGLEPRPGLRGDEPRAVFQCGTGDADVDGGVQRLIERAEHGRRRGHRVGVGTFVDDELVVDDHLIEHDLAAGGAPLPE